MNEGNLDTIDELMTAGFAFHTGLRVGFPDIKFTPEYLITDEARVAVHYAMTGTHQGEFLGAPPSHKAVKDAGTDLFHLSDGKIVTVWVSEDVLGLLRQMGVISTQS